MLNAVPTQRPPILRDHMQSQRLLGRAAAVLVALGVMVACGGDGPIGPKGDQLSAAEAQQVAIALFAEVDSALSRLGALAPTAAARSLATQPTQTFSSNCTNGGTLTGSVNYTEDFDNQGNGSLTASIDITPNACKVSTGTRLIAVGGSINFTFNLILAQGAQSGNATFHGGGSLTWSGGNCPLDYTVLFDPQGKETVSGTACGQTINFTG